MTDFKTCVFSSITLIPIVSPSLRWNGAPKSDSAFFFFFRLETCWLCALKTQNILLIGTTCSMCKRVDFQDLINRWRKGKYILFFLRNVRHPFVPSWRWYPRCVCLADVWPAAGSQGRDRSVLPRWCAASGQKSHGMRPKPAPQEGSNTSPVEYPSEHAASLPWGWERRKVMKKDESEKREESQKMVKTK